MDNEEQVTEEVAEQSAETKGAKPTVKVLNIVRWVLLLPISIMISLFVHEIAQAQLPFLPYSKDSFWIGQSLFYFRCFLSGSVFVCFGSLIAPHYKKHTAIILAVIQPIMGTLFFAFMFTRFNGDQAIFWSVYQEVIPTLLVTAIGGFVAAFLVYKFQKKKDNTQIEEQVIKTKLLKIFMTIAICVVIYFVGPMFLDILTIIIRPTWGQSSETMAISNLRTVVRAQSAYKEKVGDFTGTWDELRKAYRVPKEKVFYYFDYDIDLFGEVRRYKYTLKPAGESSAAKNGSTVCTDFECFAEPVDGGDAIRSFYVDSTGVIRYEIGKVATKESDPI